MDAETKISTRRRTERLRIRRLTRLLAAAAAAATAVFAVAAARTTGATPATTGTDVTAGDSTTSDAFEDDDGGFVSPSDTAPQRSFGPSAGVSGGS